MFRPIRRKKNEISLPAAQQLLREARRGVLLHPVIFFAADAYYSLVMFMRETTKQKWLPYAIPINYLYDEAAQKLYFHGAKVGHKVDALKACDKVCFTVYGNETIKDEPWAPYWQSVVVFGRCHLKALDAQALETLRRFALKYYPSEALVEEEIAQSGRAVQWYEITIEHLSGKEIQER